MLLLQTGQHLALVKIHMPPLKS